MITVYVYVLDTLADWELGYVTAELNYRRFFKKDAEEIIVKTVSVSKETVKTMGGMKIQPDCVLKDVEVNSKNVLILPGADTWNAKEHEAVIQMADEFLEAGGMVCAICGATVALASAGILNNRRHTSNGPGFLDMMAKDYKGQEFYVDEPAVTDGNLITAACTGSLLWAKLIIEKLGAFKPETLEEWYQYFSTGKAEHFYALMQSL